MNVVDLVVAALLVVNAILGAVRGFALQAFRLGSIVLAVWLAHSYASGFAALAESYLDWEPSQRVALGWVVIGGAIYLGMLTIGHYAKSLLQRLRMGGADRALGTLLGALKGVAYAAIGLHLLTAVTSISAIAMPDAMKEEMKTSRAFAFYLKSVRPAFDASARELGLIPPDEKK